MGSEEFERLVDDLVDGSVFEATEDGGLRPTEVFGRARETFRTEAARLDEAGFAETVEAFGVATEAVADVDASVLGDAMAIHETAGGVDRERSLLAARAIARAVVAGAAPDVPDGFVPIDGEEVGPFVRRYPATVLYVWREDCEPCDGVRATLEALIADGHVPETVGLGAVYGPDSAALIREEYQVAAAPTTLFCRAGAVDSRIVGSPDYDAFRIEVETITEGLD